MLAASADMLGHLSKIEHSDCGDGGEERWQREGMLPANGVDAAWNQLEMVRGLYGRKTSSPVATATTTR